jgi:hypothetical protein
VKWQLSWRVHGIWDGQGRNLLCNRAAEFHWPSGFRSSYCECFSSPELYRPPSYHMSSFMLPLESRSTSPPFWGLVVLSTSHDHII